MNSPILDDNKREFQRIDLKHYPTKELPLYKELTFFDLNGNEVIKLSSLNAKKQTLHREKIPT